MYSMDLIRMFTNFRFHVYVLCGEHIIRLASAMIWYTNKRKKCSFTELRQVKVVVDGIHGRNQLHSFVPVLHRGVGFFPQDSVEQYKRCGRRAAAVVPVCVAAVVVACRSTASGFHFGALVDN